ncbi:hypothetical protein BGW38_002758 [Lunasporangiospora selenospora]|uniref:Uncharacterized protein n=1 Tax=Lunasporangiospora selenospora TaxID=979761 RepID=A0A9P6KJ08_9FUNG|nr:hypothetical protein BGW38_002758 [Lunasporangiospora selenospora]
MSTHESLIINLTAGDHKPSLQASSKQQTQHLIHLQMEELQAPHLTNSNPLDVAYDYEPLEHISKAPSNPNSSKQSGLFDSLEPHMHINAKSLDAATRAKL